MIRGALLLGCGVVLGASMVAAAQTPPPSSWFSAITKSCHWRFYPDPEITAYQVALVLVNNRYSNNEEVRKLLGDHPDLKKYVIEKCD